MGAWTRRGGVWPCAHRCEKRGGRPHLIEFDPKDAELIIRRFQGYAGKAAVPDGNGRSQEVVAGPPEAA
jgi:hypothetical protein